MKLDYKKTEDRIELYKNASELWGERSQFEMAQEEATELALAIRKFYRNPNHHTQQDLAGEIANVEIMIEQMEYLNGGLRSEANVIKTLKLQRLRVRIDNNTFESNE